MKCKYSLLKLLSDTNANFAHNIDYQMKTQFKKWLGTHDIQ